MNFYQIVLPIFTLVFLLQVFVIRSIYAWKTTGFFPVVLQLQVRLEEEYLTNKLGNEYLDYKSTVLRWV